MRVHILRATIIVVTLLIGLVATSAAAALTTSPPQDCLASFNPYLYTPAALAACDIKVFPLVSVKQMSGGGQDYAYDLPGGMVAHQFILPTGFDPLQADAAQLEHFALAPRPTTFSGIASWTSAMSHLRVTAPPRFLVQLPVRAPAPSAASLATSAGSMSSGNWSGYGLCTYSGTNCTNNHYPGVQVDYREPTFNDSSCSQYTNPGPQEVTWAGIGGFDNVDQLAQDGTGHNVPGLPNDGAWYEVLPGYLTPFSPALNALAGDVIGADVQWSTGPDRYVFTIFDYATGQQAGTGVDTTSYTGDSAEAIAERPEERINGNNWFTPLSNFGTLSFTESWANNYFNTFSANGTRWGIHMSYSGTPLADPGTIGTNGAFSDTWKNCGTPVNLGP